MPKDETKISITLPDGTKTPDVTIDQMREAVRQVKRKPKVKETAEDRSVADSAYRVTADELRQFIERYERLEAEKRDLSEAQKEVMAEAKGRGYVPKIMRKVIALRKRDRDDIAEEEALLDMYRTALGM